MTDPHCIAWIKAEARLTVKTRANGIAVASKFHDVRIRFVRSPGTVTAVVDRVLDLKSTCSGWDPEVRFYVRRQHVFSMSVGSHISGGQTAQVRA